MHTWPETDIQRPRNSHDLCLHARRLESRGTVKTLNLNRSRSTISRRHVILRPPNLDHSSNVVVKFIFSPHPWPADVHHKSLMGRASLPESGDMTEPAQRSLPRRGQNRKLARSLSVTISDYSDASSFATVEQGR